MKHNIIHNERWFKGRPCKADDLFLASGGEIECGNCGARSND